METAQLEQVRLLREPSVTSLTGKSRSTLWNDIKAGTFTPPVHIGSGRSVGWPASEVTAINRARIAGKSDDEIRRLVRSLIDSRA
jgi:prophage regulatory protein